MTHTPDDYFKIQRSTTTDTGLREVADIGILQDPRVAADARLLEPQLRQWCDAYPAVPRNRIPSVCLTYAASCLNLGNHVTLATSQVTLLLFSIDDIVDGAIEPLSDVATKAYLSLCQDLVLTRGSEDIYARTQALNESLPRNISPIWHDTARALQHYCRALASTPRAELYYPFFARTFAGAMEGMIFEVESRRRFIESNLIPSYNEYLDAGKKSIASPIVCAVMLAVLAPAVDSEVINHYTSALDELMFTGGACVRLANDVRSYTREVEIEQRPNSMMILMLSERLREAAAEAEVIRRASEFLLAMDGLAADLPASLRPWAKAIRTFTALMRDWYMVREFHD